MLSEGKWRAWATAGCLILLAVRVSGWRDPCFPRGVETMEWVRVLYLDCCRSHLVMKPDAVNDLDHRVFYSLCFDEDFNPERCCQYPFGGTVRGLPWYSDQGEESIVAGRAGELRLRTRGSLMGQPNKTLRIWHTSWYWFQLVLERERLADVSRDSWSRASPVLRELASKPVLRILEIGSGVGMSAIALAKLGHKVLATDFDRLALQLARVNARLNRVQISTRHLDLFDGPQLNTVAQQGPFDLLLTEVIGIGREMMVHGDSRGNCTVEPSLASYEQFTTCQLKKVVHRLKVLLQRVQIGFLATVVDFSHSHRGDPKVGELDFLARATMRMLRAAGRTLLRPCPSLPSQTCRREPVVSPFGWLADSDIAPLGHHALLIW